MTKLRVYEYAKQLNMSSKEIITILSRLNIPVNNHMSVMESEMVAAVEGFFSDVKARAAARTAAEQQRQEQRRRQVLAAQNTESVAAGGVSRQAVGDSRGGTVTEPPIREAVREQMRETIREQAAPVEARVNDEEESLVTGARPNQNFSQRRPLPSERRPFAGGARREPYGGRPDRTPGERGPAPTVAPEAAQGSERPGERSQSRPSDRPSDRPGERPQGRPGGRPSDGGQGRSSDRPPSRPNDRPQGRPGDRPGNAYGGQSGAGDRGNRGPAGSRGPAGAPGPRYGQSSGAADRGGRPGFGNRPSQPGAASGNQGRGSGPSGGGYAGSRGPTRDAARSDGATPFRRDAAGGSQSRGPDRRNGGGFGDRRPGGFGQAPSTSASPASRHAGGAATDGARGGTAGAGQRGKRSGDRDFSANRSADKRENGRKLQQSRSRGRGRSDDRTAIRAPEGPRQVTVDGPMTVGEFARLIRREVSEVIKKLLFLGTLVTINQEIDTDAMVLVGGEFGTEVVVEAPRDIEAEEMLIEEEDSDTLENRPPVVTIMGHVDHGKTTLLDAIRQTNVTASEAGGITQHIGAYQVDVHHKKITFLDTPGHAAFTTMRARGAQVTDITVLVVAADDGVMPQTVEAINHAKAAGVPIIVAINKIDKPGATPDRIKQELTEHSLVAEEWGGDTIFVPISALKKEGIDTLLEMILLVAEVADHKASLSVRARGTVIEAQLDKGRGPVASVLLQKGTLRVGDVVVAGNTFGKLRAMVNDRGRRVKEALPSMPVEIIGLSGVPNAGDPFVVYDDERQARLVAERRTMRQRAEELGTTSRVTLDDLYKQIQEGEVRELNLILKADVHGSAEAVLGALQKIEVSGVRVRVIHSGVGAITESDILLGSASNAIVIGFNVRPEPNAAKVAETEKVEVRLYRVIYHVIDEIEAALKGMLEPEFKEVILGRAEIRQLFKVTKVGTIAGGMVQDGKIVRGGDVRLIRSGVVVYEGKIESLRRFKDDVKEVATGYEFGLTLERFSDIKEGDIIENYKMEVIKAE